MYTDNDTIHAIKQAIKEDKRKVVYRPSWKEITGSVNSAILLSQISYWWDLCGGKPFYHFHAPPLTDNKYYKPGLSWEEETGFSPGELRGAMDKICKKLSLADLKDLDTALSGHFVGTFRDQQHRTWYYFNENYFYQCLAEHYAKMENISSPNVNLTDGSPPVNSPSVNLTSGIQTLNSRLESKREINVSIPKETNKETNKETKESVQINLDLPPYKHNQLLNKWVYLKQGDSLVKAFVSGITPKRLKLGIEGEEGLKMVDPTNQVFYQNGYPELQQVILGDIEIKETLTPGALEIKNAVLDMMDKAQFVPDDGKYKQEMKDINDMSIKADKAGYNAGQFKRFGTWYGQSWTDNGKSAPPITLNIIRSNWNKFLEHENGGTHEHQKGKANGGTGYSGRSGGATTQNGRTNGAQSPRAYRVGPNSGAMAALKRMQQHAEAEQQPVA